MTMADPVPQLVARFSDTAAVATPWDDTRRVIDEAELFWISTVRADGSPHVTPLPAVWLDGALHFCTGAAEQKGVNGDSGGLRPTFAPLPKSGCVPDSGQRWSAPHQTDRRAATASGRRQHP